MTFIWYLIGILIGLFGIGSWILETYTDSPIAALWREMGGRNTRETSGSSLASPIISTGLLLLALCALISTTSSQNSTLRMSTHHHWFHLLLPIPCPPLGRRSVPVHEAPRHAGREW